MESVSLPRHAGLLGSVQLTAELAVLQELTSLVPVAQCALLALKAPPTKPHRAMLAQQIPTMLVEQMPALLAQPTTLVLQALANARDALLELSEDPPVHPALRAVLVPMHLLVMPPRAPTALLEAILHLFLALQSV